MRTRARSAPASIANSVEATPVPRPELHVVPDPEAEEKARRAAEVVVAEAALVGIARVVAAEGAEAVEVVGHPQGSAGRPRQGLGRDEGAG